MKATPLPCQRPLCLADHGLMCTRVVAQRHVCGDTNTDQALLSCDAATKVLVRQGLNVCAASKSYFMSAPTYVSAFKQHSRLSISQRGVNYLPVTSISNLFIII